jgi:apolipoprotein N-acyltransferase
VARVRFALPNLRHVLCAGGSVASGALLVLCYPYFDRSELAWIALIPLTIVALYSRPNAAAGWGYLAGAVFFVGSLYWLQHVTIAGWLLLSLFLAIYFAAWAWFVAAIHARIGGVPGSIGANLLVSFLVSAAWVGLEILRTHFLTGFPWNLLGVSQYNNLLPIQIASVTGVYGVSGLLCFVNLCLAITLLRLKNELIVTRSERRAYKPHVELMAALSLVLLAVIFGFRSTEQFRRGPSRTDSVLAIAIVQPNIPQEEKWDKEFGEMIYERLERLTTGAVHTHPDLIVWPEAATPRPLLYDRDAIRILTNAVERGELYLLTGAMTLESGPAEPEEIWYNSAYLMTPQRELLPPYHKQHLVPFGEFVPLEGWLPFMKKVTPIPGSIRRGRDFTLLPVRDARLGVVICFEDVFPDLFRRFVQQGAQVMINVTNDAWYKQSAGAHQHMANSVFRAVENRVSLVRCANTGYSCFIEPTGRVSARIAGDKDEGIFVQGFRKERVTVRASDAPQTFYTRHGDVFGWGCVGVSVVAVAGCLVRGAKRGA